MVESDLVAALEPTVRKAAGSWKYRNLDSFEDRTQVAWERILSRWEVIVRAFQDSGLKHARALARTICHQALVSWYRYLERPGRQCPTPRSQDGVPVVDLADADRSMRQELEAVLLRDHILETVTPLQREILVFLLEEDRTSVSRIMRRFRLTRDSAHSALQALRKAAEVALPEVG